MTEEQKQVIQNTFNGPVTINNWKIEAPEIADNRITPWHETWWGKTLLAVLVIILAAVLIATLGLD